MIYRVKRCDSYTDNSEVRTTLKPDIDTLKDKRTVIETQLHGSSAPRMVYNQTGNTTAVLSDKEFYEYCLFYGTCNNGKFEGTDKLFDLFAQFTPQFLKRDKRGSVYIGVRNDPRLFGLIEKTKPHPCLFKSKKDCELCESPFGLYSWRTVWTMSLPCYQECVSLHWFIRWSYKHDCIIKVTDSDTRDMLVDYCGPCGRHYEMKMEDFPYSQIGLYIPGGIANNVKMCYKTLLIYLMIQ